MSLFKIHVDSDSLNLFPTNDTSFESFTDSLSDLDSSYHSDSDSDVSSTINSISLIDSSSNSSSRRKVGFSDDVTLIAFDRKKGDALIDELMIEYIGGMDEVKELYKRNHPKNRSKLGKYLKKFFNKSA